MGQLWYNMLAYLGVGMMLCALVCGGIIAWNKDRRLLALGCILMLFPAFVLGMFILAFLGVIPTNVH